MKKLALYLAGNIQKGHEKESQLFWSDADQTYLRSQLAPHTLIFLNPATRTDDLSDQMSVFGRDMTQVFIADVVIVDARERRGLGVGAEMMWAKMNNTPVLTLAPHKSHYRKDEVNLLGVKLKNWVHPFVESLSDGLIENLHQGSLWLKQFLKGDVNIKGPQYIFEAMEHYQSTQLEHDLPMSKLFNAHPQLKERALKPLEPHCFQ